MIEPFAKNYKPHSRKVSYGWGTFTSAASAVVFAGVSVPKPMSSLNRLFGSRSLGVDYNYAKRIIKYIKKNSRKRIAAAELGLDGDWNEWAQFIFLPKDHYRTYRLKKISTWCMPTLLIHYTDGSNEAHRCYEIVC